MIFEADTNPRARIGRDLRDLEGKVRRISINSRADGTTELGAITDPKQVAGMVRMLLTAPVDQRVQPTAAQPRWLLAFHLLDGTATVRSYDPGDRRVQQGHPGPPAGRRAGRDHWVLTNRWTARSARLLGLVSEPARCGDDGRGQARAQQASTTWRSPSSCHNLRPTPPVMGRRSCSKVRKPPAIPALNHHSIHLDHLVLCADAGASPAGAGSGSVVTSSEWSATAGPALLGRPPRRLDPIRRPGFQIGCSLR